MPAAMLSRITETMTLVPRMHALPWQTAGAGKGGRGQNGRGEPQGAVADRPHRCDAGAGHPADLDAADGKPLRKIGDYVVFTLRPPAPPAATP